MDRDVFADPQVQQALTDGIASVKVDVTHEPVLSSGCGATSVPRYVVLFPDGSIETVHVGFSQKQQYLNLLRDVADRGKKMAVPKPSDPQAPASIVSNEPSQAVPSTAKDSSAEIQPAIVVSEASEPSIDPPLIGLEGFCPVLLHEKREWVAGNDAITADYRGVRYVFSSAASREVFLKNPSTYAPQDLGCDAVVLTDTQRAITGSIRFGAFFDQKLYLFQSPENRDQFKQNPLKFVRIRSALRVDQIEGSKFQ